MSRSVNLQKELAFVGLKRVHVMFPKQRLARLVVMQPAPLVVIDRPSHSAEEKLKRYLRGRRRYLKQIVQNAVERTSLDKNTVENILISKT